VRKFGVSATSSFVAWVNLSKLPPYPPIPPVLLGRLDTGRTEKASSKDHYAYKDLCCRLNKRVARVRIGRTFCTSIRNRNLSAFGTSATQCRSSNPSPVPGRYVIPYSIQECSFSHDLVG